MEVISGLTVRLNLLRCWVDSGSFMLDFNTPPMDPVAAVIKLYQCYALKALSFSVQYSMIYWIIYLHYIGLYMHYILHYIYIKALLYLLSNL